MDLKDIQNLIKFVAKSGASEVKLEMEDIKITVKTGSGKEETTIIQQAPIATNQIPVISQVATLQDEVAPAKAAEEKTESADAKYLFNEIESEVSGKIVKILVEDSSPVEFGQPLFLVDPS